MEPNKGQLFAILFLFCGCIDIAKADRVNARIMPKISKQYPRERKNRVFDNPVCILVKEINDCKNSQVQQACPNTCKRFQVQEESKGAEKFYTYAKHSTRMIPSSKILKDSHFKFTHHLHNVNWREIAIRSTPDLNEDRVDFLLSLAGAYSLNPLLLIASVQVNDDMKLAPTDRKFYVALKQMAEGLARAHLNHGQHPNHQSPTMSLRHVFKEDGFENFVELYSNLHNRYDVPLTTETDNILIMERDSDLNNTMQWPWKVGHCWELGPTHGGSIEGLTNYIPASLDMGPSLYNDWKFNYHFLGSNGTVVAAHDGVIYIHSGCSLEIKSGVHSTYYGHIEILSSLQNNMTIKQGTEIGKIEIRPDKALCLCNWEEASYSCSTGPHLHFEVRRNGMPISLNNMVIGGIRIRAGKYERDASCTDPEHCMLAKDSLDTPCATYFIDQDNNIYCPSVRGNTGGNFNYGRDPGWKLPGRPVMNPGGNIPSGNNTITSITPPLSTAFTWGNNWTDTTYATATTPPNLINSTVALESTSITSSSTSETSKSISTPKSSTVMPTSDDSQTLDDLAVLIEQLLKAQNQSISKLNQLIRILERAKNAANAESQALEQRSLDNTTREETTSNTCAIRTNRRCNPQTWDEFGGYSDGCCTAEQQCGEGEGDCSEVSDCMAGLVCGNNNCPKDLGFGARADCCEPFADTFKPIYGFKMISNKDCIEHKYGEYSLVEAAKHACKLDSNCSAVYDVDCGAADTFYLCPDVENMLNNSASSCVHDKIIIDPCKQITCGVNAICKVIFSTGRAFCACPYLMVGDPYVRCEGELGVPTVLVAIELMAREDTTGITWNILDTNCKSEPNLIVTQNRVYKTSCGLSMGKTYRLKCGTSGMGWKSNHLVIENSIYCEGTESEQILNITVTGAAPKQCPVDFPYAFNYGKLCCSYGKDKDGNIISFRSSSCIDSSYRHCTLDRCLDNAGENHCAIVGETYDPLTRACHCGSARSCLKAGFKAPVGQNCPEGTVINTKDSCIIQAQKLGYDLGSCSECPQSTYPSGCFYEPNRQLVWFNGYTDVSSTNPANSSFGGLCSLGDGTGFAVGKLTDPKCAIGYTRITTIDDCKRAAEALGSIYSREGDWNDIPSGCYRSKSLSIYFNYNDNKDYHTATNLGLQDGLVTVCKAYGDFFVVNSVNYCDAKSSKCTCSATEDACTSPKYCLQDSCSVDGRWSDWADYNDCSDTCGRGWQTRTRECSSPPPSGRGSNCSGDSIQTRDCEEKLCPGNEEWVLTSRGNQYCHETIVKSLKNSLNECKNYCKLHGAKRLAYFPRGSSNHATKIYCRCCSRANGPLATTNVNNIEIHTFSPSASNPSSTTTPILLSTKPGALTWTITLSRWCDGYYDHYLSLDLAKAACLGDIDCGGVYDEGCSGTQLKLCKTWSNLWFSGGLAPSCVHTTQDG